MTTEKIKDCIKEIVEMLSIKAYSEIARKQFLKALSEEDIAESIADYGGAVTMPPDLNDFWNFDFYFMADDKNILSIEYNLLIDDVRKRSDAGILL